MFSRPKILSNSSVCLSKLPVFLHEIELFLKLCPDTSIAGPDKCFLLCFFIASVSSPHSCMIWILFIVPTFDTKVTEYLCSGWVFFFLQTNFDFLTSHFWRKFFISFESYCCPELKFEKIFHLWSFFVKLWGFKDCHFGHFDQFGTINARYVSRY